MATSHENVTAHLAAARARAAALEETAALTARELAVVQAEAAAAAKTVESFELAAALAGIDAAAVKASTAELEALARREQEAKEEESAHDAAARLAAAGPGWVVGAGAGAAAVETAQGAAPKRKADAASEAGSAGAAEAGPAAKASAAAVSAKVAGDPNCGMMFKGVKIPAKGTTVTYEGRLLTYIGVETRRPSFPFMFKDSRTGRTVNLRGSAFAEALGQRNNNDGEVLYYNGVTVTVGKVYQLTDSRSTRVIIRGEVDVKRRGVAFRGEVVTKDDRPTGETVRIPYTIIRGDGTAPRTC